jgi:hypothetical protein
MRNADRGPRDLQELVVLAGEWQSSDKKDRPALVSPGGVFDPRRFLGGEPLPGDGPPLGAGEISPWDLLAGMAASPGVVRRGLAALGVSLPDGPRWRAGQPLAWFQLDGAAQDVVAEAIMTLLDVDGRLTEHALLLLLTPWPGLAWDQLPEPARRNLERSGQTARTWSTVLSLLPLQDEEAAS